MKACHETSSLDLIAPREKHSSWCWHEYREYNKEADALATQGLTSCTSSLVTRCVRKERPIALLAMFDGGRRDSFAGSGWIVRSRWHGEMGWTEVACASLYIGDETSTFAELFAATQALLAVL